MSAPLSSVSVSNTGNHDGAKIRNKSGIFAGTGTSCLELMTALFQSGRLKGYVHKSSSSGSSDDEEIKKQLDQANDEANGVSNAAIEKAKSMTQDEISDMLKKFATLAREQFE